MEYYYGDLAGKEMTVSIEVNGVMTSGQISWPAAAPASANSSVNIDIGTLRVYFSFTYWSGGAVLNGVTRTHVPVVTIENIGTTNVTIGIVKMEPGKVSTATTDAPMNFARELEKCLRYYWEGEIDNAFGYRYFNTSTGYAEAGLHTFASKMRITPTMTFLIAPTYTNCSAASIYTNASDGFCVRVTVAAAGMYRATGGRISADARL
jgi:hypothetical protein